MTPTVRPVLFTGETAGSAKWVQVHNIGETMVAVHQRAGGKHFNILGFFGCCFHCKHDPECTGRCMHKHHIQNGFGDESTQTEAMSQSRLVEASEALALMQVQEGEDGLLAYHRHKPIKLVLPEGSSKTHKAPERPSNTGSTAEADHDSATLERETNQSNDFSINEFFHCAYGCKHRVKCEKKCMSRHGIVE